MMPKSKLCIITVIYNNNLFGCSHVSYLVSSSITILPENKVYKQLLSFQQVYVEIIVRVCVTEQI